MFGYVAAVLGGFAFARVLRYRRCGGRGRMFGRHGMRRWNPWSHRLMAALDATPSQEKVIQQTIEEITAAFQKRRNLPGLGEFAASAIAEDQFDRAAFAAKLAPEAEDEFRQTVSAALERLHAALDPAQRRKLAELLRRFTR